MDAEIFLVFPGLPGAAPTMAGLSYRGEAMVPVWITADMDMAKAGDVPAGARWLTVHPHGDGSKGVPVLVQEQKHGSGVWHVIGGAGGKLNYLKVRGVKSESEYKEEAVKKAKTKREADKAQRERDKAAGLDTAKSGARQAIEAQRREGEREFVRSVSDAMGWDPDELEFDEKAHEHLPDDMVNKARQAHHRELMKRANEAVGLQRRRLVADAEARTDGGLTDIPVDTLDPDVISVADLDLSRPSASTGVAADFGRRAKDNGLTQDALADEVAEVRAEATGKTKDEVKAKTAERGEVAKVMKEEMEKARAGGPDLSVKLADAEKAVEMLKAQKKLKALNKAAREARRQVDASKVAPEPQAYILEVKDEATDAQVMADVMNDLGTVRTRAFLSEYGAMDPDGEALGGHLATGAFNSINSLSQAAGGTSMIDRSVVDVLGVAGAAQVLARKLRMSLGDEEADKVAAGMEDFHRESYMGMSRDALAQAQELQAHAEELSLPEATTPDDFAEALALNKKKKELLAEAGKVMGQALGEMEANAALVVALKERGRDSLQVSLGDTSIEAAVQQVRALGLDRGEYKIEKAAGTTFLTLGAQALDKLASPADTQGAELVRRNMAIMKGEFDEDGWLPQGFANRPDLAMDIKPGAAPSFAIPFSPGDDLSQSIRDYVGARAADGDKPADILSDLQSQAFFDKAGDPQAYRAALDAVAPNKDANGKSLQRAEQLEGLFNGYADDFVASRHGPGARAPLHRQNIEPDHLAQEAMHRTLSDEPAGAAAFKPIGELTAQDQRTLREHFRQHVARESDEQKTLREKFEALGQNEPEKTTTDMFGEETANPEHEAWQAERNELAEKVRAAGLSWPDYVKTMRGVHHAYASMQDMIRSTVCDRFAHHYNRINPAAPLKVGRALLRGNLNHLDAVDPQARQERVEREREIIDSLRERDHTGRYAAGAIAHRLDAARDSREAFEQAQMGFGDMFGDDEPSTEPQDHPLGLDERHSLGHAMERTLSGLANTMGAQFKPGQPVKLFQPGMSGPSGAPRQRAIKYAEANKRMVLGFGVGSGKTGIGLGAFAHLRSKGQAKKGIYVVPSIVQGQFGAEALRFLEPGKFKWHCEPGASHEDRMASYKDASTDFHVVTHQSFRDDVLKMAARQDGIEPEEVADKLETMSKEGRAAYMRGVMEREGINFDFVMADEAHGLLNREGKENSRMSNAIEAVTDNSEHYIHASGDPVKNDASEIFSLLQKMDGKRYNDRDAFMRRYGGDTQAARDGLRREMARHVYASSLTPDVPVDRRVETVPLTDDQRKALSDVDRHITAARVAKMDGRADLAALKALSPSSFDGVPEDQHEAVAKNLSDSLGMIKGAAQRRILDEADGAGKLDAVVRHAAARRGQPGVIFARYRKSVENIKARLEAEGHRVITITGSDSAKHKGDKIRAFNPDSGERSADIVICSDAGATGANLQSGKWLAQYDTPDTSMVHAQRQGRIYRTGQKGPIELTDFVADHEAEHRARGRLRDKYELRDLVTSPLETLDDTGVGMFLRRQQVQREQESMF